MSKLFLQNNRLDKANFLVKVSTLQEIDIANNQFTELTIEEIGRMKKLQSLQLMGNPWKCSCAPDDRLLMDFLMIHGSLPCCPKLCSCSANINTKSVVVDCHAANLKALPFCLPFEEAKLNLSHNSIEYLRFTQGQENLTSIDLSTNRLRHIDGPSLLLPKKLEMIDISFNFLHIAS